MGSKISKNRGSSDEFSAECHSFQSMPYRFLDTSEIQSSQVPNMIKMFLKPPKEPRRVFRRRGQPLSNASKPGSSLEFLKDENRLLLGVMIFVPALRTDETAEEESSWFDFNGWNEDDNLCQVDLNSTSSTNDWQELTHQAVRDISVSANTEHVATLTYRGYCQVQLWRFDNASNLYCIDKLEQRKNIASHSTCCAISPNGKWLVVAVCSNYFVLADTNHLDIYTINRKKLNKKQNVCFDNKNRVCTFLTSLEFSSDSKFLAIGSCAQSRGARVFLLSTKTWKIISEIQENIIPDYSTIWAVFNPLATHYELISLTKLGYLTKWDASSLYTEANLEENLQLVPIDKKDFSNGGSVPISVTLCPIFSSDGSMLAIPLLDGRVLILDPNLFETLWIISRPDFQFEFQHVEEMPQELAVRSLCFSKSCEYLAIGYSALVISVWLVPRLHFSLKHFCRTKIISMCPPSLVHELPIPDALKQYLLFQL